MVDFKKIISFLALGLFLSLAACDSESEHLIPIGTKLPGDFIVNESRLFKGADECLVYAREVQTNLHAETVQETHGKTIYAAAFRAGGKEMIQVCTERSKKNVSYSSAIK